MLTEVILLGGLCLLASKIEKIPSPSTSHRAVNLKSSTAFSPKIARTLYWHWTDPSGVQPRFLKTSVHSPFQADFRRRGGPFGHASAERNSPCCTWYANSTVRMASRLCGTSENFERIPIIATLVMTISPINMIMANTTADIKIVRPDRKDVGRFVFDVSSVAFNARDLSYNIHNISC